MAFGVYGAIGLQLAISVVAGLWVGYYLDQKWGTFPWLFLVGLIIGSIGGFWNLLKLLKWKERRGDH